MSLEPGSAVHRDAQRTSDLTADCDRCCGLCCVATTFAASSEFAIDKAGGEVCPNLDRDFGCAIHTQLRAKGFAGCVAFDCFGAGQKVTQETFGGKDWRENPQVARQMFEIFLVMRQLHTLLFYLRQALDLPSARSMHQELESTLAQIEGFTNESAATIADLDIRQHKSRAHALLLRVSALVRTNGGRA